MKRLGSEKPMKHRKGTPSILLRDISEKAISAFGEAAGRAFVEKLWESGASWFEDNVGTGPPEVSPLAIQSYLQRGAFSPLARRQVVAWAMWELGQLSNNEAQIVLQTVSAQSDPASAVDAVIVYFARLRFGL